jgi:hypothetical protein
MKLDYQLQAPTSRNLKVKEELEHFFDKNFHSITSPFSPKILFFAPNLD